MFDFSASSDAPKGEIYRELREAALALTAGESDGVANMANGGADLAIPARIELGGVLPRGGR
jgi:hypothetical protein